MITIYSDGATEGWNGKLGTVTHCGIGFYCEDTQYQCSKRIKAISSNEAEFYALIEAMEWALRSDYREVEFKLDSQIIVNRAKRGFIKKAPKKGKDRCYVMDGFQRIVMGLAKQFKVCLFTWVPREQNTMADYLSKYSLLPKAITL